MVDFNNEATIGVSAVDIERISILQRRYDFIEAFEDYKKKRLGGAKIPLSTVKARLGSLFYELQATFKRRLSNEQYLDIKNKCFNKEAEEEDLINLFYIINEELDKMNLTRIDNKKSFDFKDAEKDNESVGL